MKCRSSEGECPLCGGFSFAACVRNRCDDARRRHTDPNWTLDSDAFRRDQDCLNERVTHGKEI